MSTPVTSATSTGTPVTLYVTPFVGAHWRIATARRIKPIASARSRSVRSGFSRTWMTAEWSFGNR